MKPRTLETLMRKAKRADNNKEQEAKLSLG